MADRANRTAAVAFAHGGRFYAIGAPVSGNAETIRELDAARLLAPEAKKVEPRRTQQIGAEPKRSEPDKGRRPAKKRETK